MPEKKEEKQRKAPQRKGQWEVVEAVDAEHYTMLVAGLKTRPDALEAAKKFVLEGKAVFLSLMIPVRAKPPKPVAPTVTLG